MDKTIVNRYRVSSVETASPAQLVLMLYDGAIKFAKQAEEAARARRIEEANRAIGRVQDILAELMSSLNVDAGEVAGNLFAIYDYLNRRLVEANIKKDPEIVSEVVGHLLSLREAWVQMARGVKNFRQGETGTQRSARLEGKQEGLSQLSVEV